MASGDPTDWKIPPAVDRWSCWRQPVKNSSRRSHSGGACPLGLELHGRLHVPRPIRSLLFFIDWASLKSLSRISIRRKPPAPSPTPRRLVVIRRRPALLSSRTAAWRGDTG